MTPHFEAGPDGGPFEPHFHAHRAAFGAPTSTTDPGDFEVQFGIGYDPRAEVTDVPLAVLYGLDEATELKVELSAYEYEVAPGEDTRGMGDALIGIRHRVRDQDDWPSLAFQAAVTLPTGDEEDGLGSGEHDLFLATVFGFERELSLTTMFYEVGSINDVGGGTHPEHALAIVHEQVMGQDWGVFAEGVTFYVPGDDFVGYAIGAGISKHIVEDLAWDFGVSYGLGDLDDAVRLTFGFTWAIDRRRKHQAH